MMVLGHPLLVDVADLKGINHLDCLDEDSLGEGEAYGAVDADRS